MRGTCLVYSSHNRCWYIHEQRIVRRALEGMNNKRILFLPFSEMPNSDGNEFPSQKYGFDKFNWFFQKYVHLGLEVVPFFFSSGLRREDVEILFDLLQTSEVVILGGGNTSLGMRRFRELGQNFYGDPELFSRLLHERQENGLFTVGFSAGADQLCQYVATAIDYNISHPWGFGLARNIVVTLHHEPFSGGSLIRGSRAFPHCLVFGLPNDSGLEVMEGRLPSGLIYQLMEFIIDNSWDNPYEEFHIKTRQGTKIDHFYPDTRHWGFNGGDMILRIIDPNDDDYRAWIISNGQILDYWTQQPAPFGSIDAILNQFS